MNLMTFMVMMTVIMWGGCSQPPAVILVIFFAPTPSPSPYKIIIAFHHQQT